MELAQALVTSIVIAVIGGSVTWAMVGQFRSLRRELDARSVAIDQRFDGVGQRFDSVDQRFDRVAQRFDAVAQRDGVDQRFDGMERRFERVEGSIDALRSDLTQVALAVGARPRAQNG